MTQPAAALRVGELRPSQLLHTYGIGSVADLPNLSVMVLGLDRWDTEETTILTEDRLLAAVRRKLGAQVATLRTPPYTPETRDMAGPWTRVGVPVGIFPRWLRCSDLDCNRLAPVDSGLFVLVPNSRSPEKTRYVHECKGTGNKRPTAIPARFLIACPDGHLDDFPWMFFVHRGEAHGDGHTLTLKEHGTTGEAANIHIECSCDRRRSLAEAIGERGESTLPLCRGRHPHLGSFGPCTQPVRTMALGATNGWFAAQLRVFSLPKADEPLEQAVREYWNMLGPLAMAPEVAAKALMPTQSCWPRLEPYGVDAVWEAVRRETARVGNASSEPADDESDLATPEWRAFTRPRAVQLPDFTTSLEPSPERTDDWLEQVVLVRRLREVAALTGFTRIDAPEWDPRQVEDSRLAPLSSGAPTWLPCAESRGEGIFLKFSESAVAAWEAREHVRAREDELRRAHVAWCLARGVEPEWPGARYALLHTFAHMLIREFALECGYGASGMSERIYARTGADPMAGILLYTAASDSEGTLGGLVSLGKRARLGSLLEQAVNGAKLCSSDPLCAEHDPTVGGRLHGAACHACLFAAETSCENGNRFLDRALLVDTLALAGGASAFFPG